jgi:spermidine synthase
MLFFSGASALVYEIAWQRQLVLVLGSTAQALACVLSVFMAGLSSGAYAGGRLSDRTVHHMRYYAWCEILIGLTAATATIGFSLLPDLLGQWQRDCGVSLGWQKLLLSCLPMLPATFFMGASLPLAVRALTATAGDEKPFSVLYGANLLGGAAGVLTACFIGFSYLGITATVMLGALSNLVIGAVAWRQPQSPGSHSNVPGGLIWPGWFVMSVAVLSGFITMSIEVLWTRFLRYYTTSTTYAFALMLAVFLLGLYLATRLQKPNRTPENLGNYFGLSFMSVLGTYFALPLADHLVQIIGATLGWFVPGTLVAVIASAIVALVYLLGPAVCCGLIFPAIGDIASASAHPGKALGAVYAANTLGCIAGSIATVLLLVPLVGSQYSLLICLVLTAGAAIICYLQSDLSRPKIVAAVVALFLGLLAFKLLLPDFFLETARAADMRARLVGAGEDASSSVAVLAFPGFQKMMINGEPYSSTALHGQRYMRLIGHLPCLIHPAPKHALSVCYGTGTTSGATVMHPEVETLDIVELSPAVISASPLFNEVNHEVLSNEKTTLHVNDIRNYLQSCQGCWDVITFEPPPPYDAGVSHLYTREFYELVKTRMCPGAIICQWVPMGLQSEPLWKMMIASAASVFKSVTVWCPNNREALLLASDSQPPIDLSLIRQRMDSDPVKQSLHEVGFDSPEAILSTLLLNDEQVRGYCSGAANLTDDKPALEFFLAYPFKLVYPGDFTADAGAIADNETVQRQFQAMRLLRQAGIEVDRRQNLTKAREYLQQINQMVPDNIFFRWAEINAGIQG